MRSSLCLFVLAAAGAAGLRATPSASGPTAIRIPRANSRTMPSVTCALIDDLFAIEDEAERRGALESAIRAWQPSERSRQADELSAEVAERATDLQQAALKQEKEGTYDKEVTEVALYALVELTVGIRVLLQRVQAEDEGSYDVEKA